MLLEYICPSYGVNLVDTIRAKMLEIRVRMQIGVLAVSFLIPVAFNVAMKIAIPLKIVSVGIPKGLAILPILVNNVFQVFTRPIAGWLAEKTDHRVVFGSATLLYGAGFMLYLSSRTPFDVYISSIVLGLGIASFWSAFLAYSSYIDEKSASQGLAKALSISFVGAFVGTILSGFVFEYYGFHGTFVFATIVVVSAIFFILLLPKMETHEIDLGKALRITSGNIRDLFLNANAVSLVPIVNTYAPILLIDAGVSPSIAGIILTAFPIFSAITQILGGYLYRPIIRYRLIINILANFSMILFALSANLAVLPLTILFFVMYSFASSLLFTPQLTKSIEEGGEARAVGSGGFGSGMNATRVLGSVIATMGGYIAEEGLISIQPAVSAIVFTSVAFIFISILSACEEYLKMQ